jgi:hypothetical protein
MDMIEISDVTTGSVGDLGSGVLACLSRMYIADISITSDGHFSLNRIPAVHLMIHIVEECAFAALLGSRQVRWNIPDTNQDVLISTSEDYLEISQIGVEENRVVVHNIRNFSSQCLNEISSLLLSDMATIHRLGVSKMDSPSIRSVLQVDYIF